MSRDLPIYSDPMLRTRLQFADLERLRSIDTSRIWDKSDAYIELLEGASNARQARESVQELSKEALLTLHSILFKGGGLRRHSIAAPYRGQDCPDPEFLDRSLDNFFGWLTASSVAEIHPIERAALVFTRIVDIWPFEAGNLTVAMISANLVLRDAGLPPFFVLPDHVKEFHTVVAQAITIETQPLVNAIHRTIKREIDTLAG